MMQSISTHFRLTANHAGKQVMLNFWKKNSAYAQIGDVKTAIILTEFLVDKNKINGTNF